jgi:hypothetical protein
MMSPPAQTISQQHYVDPASGALVFPSTREEALAVATAKAVLKLSDYLRFEAHIELPSDVKVALEDLRNLVR